MVPVRQFVSAPGRVYIRASSTPEALDCKRRWAGRHLREMLVAAGYEARDLPTHCGAPIGTGVHALAATLLRGKRDQGQLPPFEDAEEVGMAAMDEAFGQNEILWDHTALNRTDAWRQLQRMGLVYADQVAAFADALLVEERMEAPWEVPGYLITGQLDNLLRLDAGNRLHDLKTGQAPGGAGAQIGTYDMLAEHAGFALAGLEIDFIQRTELRRMQPGAVRFPVDQAAVRGMAEQAIDGIVASTARFQADGNVDHFQPNPSSRLCQDKFCPLWGTKTCRVHLRGNQ